MEASEGRMKEKFFFWKFLEKKLIVLKKKKISKRQKRSNMLEKRLKKTQWKWFQGGGIEGKWWKMKNAQISDYFQRPNEHEGARNQTWPWKDKSSFAKSSACTQSFGTFGAFLEILVPEDAKQSMKMS